jgi:glycosyltransferase involved in cell wall biosynthesis
MGTPPIASMRIALVIPEFPPDAIGGGGVVFQALVREYVARHQVMVFTAADSTRSWTRGRYRDCTETAVINRYPLIPLGKRIPYLRSAMPPNVRGWLELRRDLTTWSPQVAHVHGYGHAFIDLASGFLAKQGVPYIFTCHGIPSRPMRRNSVIRAAFKTYQRFGPERVIRSAHRVTAVSAAAAANLVHPKQIEIVPNGVSPMAVSNPLSARELRLRLAIPDSVALVAAAGRLSIEKGFDILIKALDKVQVARLFCVIAGSDGGAGPELAELAARCRPGISVSFPGRLSPQSITDLFSTADLVVVPSREESFGLVALEALAVGKRLVASRAGGLVDFLQPGLAQLVARDDPIALAAAITDSLARGPLTSGETEAVAGLVARYSWSSVAIQYEQLLSEAATP